MTGIPLSRLEQEESKKLLHLEDELRKRVIGQDKALEAVARASGARARAFTMRSGPLPRLSSWGPRALARPSLPRRLPRTCSAPKTRLCASTCRIYGEVRRVEAGGRAPRILGYEEGGQLSEKIRKKPYSVILLDEIEKAHPDVFNILLQILDDGLLTDSYGRHVNFKNTIIIMTSNAGTRDVRKTGSLGSASPPTCPTTNP